MFFLLSASIHFLSAWWLFDNHLSNALFLSFIRELPGIDAIQPVKPSKIALSFNFLLIFWSSMVLIISLLYKNFFKKLY